MVCKVSECSEELKINFTADCNDCEGDGAEWNTPVKVIHFRGRRDSIKELKDAMDRAMNTLESLVTRELKASHHWHDTFHETATRLTSHEKRGELLLRSRSNSTATSSSSSSSSPSASSRAFSIFVVLWCLCLFGTIGYLLQAPSKHRLQSRATTQVHCQHHTVSVPPALLSVERGFEK